MKTILSMILVFLSCGTLSAQELEGSWKLVSKNDEPVKTREVIKIIQDGYFAYGTKEIANNYFINAAGGEFTLEGADYTEIRDFDTADPNIVGKEQKYDLKWDGKDKIVVSDEEGKEVWQRISDKTDELTGNWVITGRKRDGQMQTMTPGNRRTVKILSGERFQWIAFNSASKEFSGTGGGTYTAENGKYTENIEFFSRDNRRVGAGLEFDYEIKDGQWHHKGTSSKGDPVYEIWSSYNEAYKK